MGCTFEFSYIGIIFKRVDRLKKKLKEFRAREKAKNQNACIKMIY